MSKELELIAEAMRDVATEGHNDAPGARDDGQLWGAFPNTMTVHDLAAHVVSRLSDAGYSIVQLPEAESKHTLTSGQSYEAFPIWATVSPVIAWSDGDVSIEEYIGDISASDARELGLILLAAAAAAEEEKPWAGL
ncbi:hypothetical protein [Rhodococcoides fascians]|uniref:hypothetical protein n=1 Tax=Rhodococcoides fascians TaxID=1828 RepID=UPI00056571AA|nr:hypothetical protein [Rhodococcus fascians]